jgi:hypothetical protein
MKMTYDRKCYELAKSFLQDHPSKNSDENADFLAQCIQQEIEETIEDLPENNQ